MKVLNIMLSRGLGGIQQAFLDYNTALKLQNIEPINVTSFGADINSLIPRTGIKLPNLSSIDFFSIFFLKYIIYKVAPDVIIAHGNRAINFCKIAKPKKITLIGVAHNYSLKNFKKCDYIITLTNHMRRYLLSNQFPDTKIFSLPNMINLRKKFVSNKNYHSPTTIGMLARFVPKKGCDIFIRALYILKKQGYNFKAIIGGDGIEKKNLLNLTHELQLSTDIHFPGWIKNKEEFFSSLDIFCLPSLHEPFGIILLEAMEHSLPIIATNTEGPNEIITHMETGIIYDASSIEELAKQIIYLMSNPSIAAKLSKAAYIELKKNYEMKIIAKKLAIFINHISSVTNTN